VTAQSEPTTTPDVARIRALPRSDRVGGLRELVVTELRAALLMEPGEVIPPRVSFFDLGLTSRSVYELRQRLEDRLGHPVSTTVMFNEPTLDQLVALFADELGLTEAGVDAPVPASAPEPAGLGALVNDLLRIQYDE
jgi:hypothetical protein